VIIFNTLPIPAKMGMGQSGPTGLITQATNITWKLLAIRAGYIRLGVIPTTHGIIS